jgi:transketolase
VNHLRQDLVDICVKNEAGHIAPSLSILDVLTALYYRVMDLSPDPRWEGRDRLIFSKAHGCYGVYAILADLGYLGREQWETFYRGSPLTGCMERNVGNGIEAGCGSLGHGLPMAAGIAFGAKLQKKTYRVYCIIGDGEIQEGSNWEAIQFAVKHKLSNLTVIIDHNRLQAMDFLKNILTPEESERDLEKKMKSFGFLVRSSDGHSFKKIVAVLEKWKRMSGELSLPQVLVANTTKGYGLLCMEDIAKFHFRLPTEEELRLGNRYGCPGD